MKRLACALALSIAVTGCGAQIPFGTPGVSGPPAATRSPGATPSVGPGETAAPSVGETAGPTSPPGSAPGSAPASAPASSPVATLPPEAPAYTVKAVNLQLNLPAGWVGYDAETPQAAINDAIIAHPELADALGLLQSGLAFVAVDAAAAGGGGQAASLTISATGSAIPSRSLLESLGRTTAEQIKASQPVDGDVAQTTIELSSGPAVNLVWQLQPVAGAEALGLDAYLLTVGERTFAATFAAPISVRDGFQPAFRAIVETMRTPS